MVLDATSANLPVDEIVITFMIILAFVFGMIYGKYANRPKDPPKDD